VLGEFCFWGHPIRYQIFRGHIIYQVARNGGKKNAKRRLLSKKKKKKRKKKKLFVLLLFNNIYTTADMAEAGVKRGYLTKRGRVVKNWKRRYFVLSKGSLSYYENEDSVVPKGTMSLYGAAVVYVEPPKIDRSNCIEITNPARSLFVSADTREELQGWALTIQREAIIASGGKVALSSMRLQHSGQERAEVETKANDNAANDTIATTSAATTSTAVTSGTTATSTAVGDGDGDGAGAGAATGDGDGDGAASAAGTSAPIVVAAPETGTTTTATPLTDSSTSEPTPVIVPTITFSPVERKRNQQLLQTHFVDNQPLRKKQADKQAKQLRKETKDWDIEAAKPRKSIKGHAEAVTSLSLFENTLVSGSSDKTVRVWDATTLKALAVCEGHTSVIKAIVQTKQVIVTASDDATVRIWSRSTYKCVASLQTLDQKTPADELAVTEDGQILVAACGNHLQVWSLDSFKCIQVIKDCHGDSSSDEAKITSMAIYAQYVITGGADRAIKAWNVVADDTKEALVADVQQAHSNWVFSMCILGDRLYSGAENIKMWDISSVRKGKIKSKQTLEEPHQSPSVQCLHITQDQRYLVSSGLDGFARVWKPDIKKKRSACMLAEFEMKSKFIFALCTSQKEDERRLFVAERAVIRAFF
jgi:PH domain/WD domain, G-beta repeat